MFVVKVVLKLRAISRYLSYNKITSIENGDFTELDSLTTLSVGITFVIVLKLCSSDIHRDLQFNQIAAIKSSSFTGLNSLSNLSVVSMPRILLVLSFHLITDT